MSKRLPNPTNGLAAHIKTFQNNFIELIHDRLGIIIHPHQTSELCKTVIKGCEKFNCTVEEYLAKLTNHPDDSPMLEHLIAGITVNETYFFRDKHQMQLLQNTLLPQLIASKRAQKNLTLRIWSAGCASGEEIYTVAMMLLELLPDLPAWQIQLLGTDLNIRSLQKALAGQYTEWSMRSISNYFKQLYFIRENNHYILSEKIRSLVRFGYLNLNDNTYPSFFNGTHAQDLILCRNVLIYFDNDRLSELMKKLSDSLVRGGFLLLGASDPIMTEGTPLISHHQQGIFFSRPSSLTAVPLPTKSTVEKIKKIPHVHIPSKMHVKPDAACSALVRPAMAIQDPQNISQLLNEHRWQEALATIHHREREGKKNSSLLNSKAIAYANLGQLDQSLQSCIESLSLDATNKDTYFTFALTLSELNRLDEAEEAFRKTLFLDRHFVAGHFQLGLLLLRKKQHEMGIKSLTNALAIAKAKEPSESVPGYQGMNYEKLSEIFKQEIELYTAKGNIEDAS